MKRTTRAVIAAFVITAILASCGVCLLTADQRNAAHLAGTATHTLPSPPSIDLSTCYLAILPPAVQAIVMLGTVEREALPPLIRQLWHSAQNPA